MGIIERIWHRLATGNAAPAPEPIRSKSKKPRQPIAKDELTLADGPPEKKHSRPGSAGIDPYSNDAGFSKPHSWERVDHD